jgi:hypothetical protein
MDPPQEDINSPLLVRETIEGLLVGLKPPSEEGCSRSNPVSSDRGRMLNTSHTKGVNPLCEIEGKLPCEGKSVPDGSTGASHSHNVHLPIHSLDLRKRTGGPLACEGKGHGQTVRSICSEEHMSPARTPWVHGCSCVSILCFCRLPGTPPRTRIIPRKDLGCVTSGVLAV